MRNYLLGGIESNSTTFLSEAIPVSNLGSSLKKEQYPYVVGGTAIGGADAEGKVIYLIVSPALGGSQPIRHLKRVTDTV